MPQIKIKLIHGLSAKMPLVDCQWTSWDFGECSEVNSTLLSLLNVQCGNATQRKNRTILVLARHQGKCEGESEEIDVCILQSCVRKYNLYYSFKI